MIKNIKNNYFLGTIGVLFCLTSCQDYVEVDPQDKLNSNQVYRDVFDADAAVVGIYGKFMGLAEKYVVLNELRADLISPTQNSGLFLQELNEHSVTSSNPYANPKDFYEVINNCNDVLKNFEIMVELNKMDVVEFNERYSDIGTLRSWLYLQLGIHFGEVPYITEPIEDINDIKNLNQYSRIPFNQLIDELINFTESLPHKDTYSAGSSLLINVDGHNTAKFFINKECLLGDLQLWKGNYLEAASHYKTVMETGSNGSDSYLFDTYRVKYNLPNSNDIGVEYERYREQDARAIIASRTDGWGSIFTRDADANWNMEWIWSLPFDFNFAPKDPFLNIFLIDYVLKPSETAITLWDDEKQQNDFPYDARGKVFSYIMINERPYVKKYVSFVDNSNGLSFYVGQSHWFLYRAAKLHLRYAEAANRDGEHRLADALLNFGIQEEYTDDNQTDVTNIEQTKLPFPYDFDARQGDFPYFRGNWHRNGGIRGRAYVQRAEVVGDSLISIENNLIKEAALELAFEGNRWGDLVRIALRRNDPAFLADKIYDKLVKEGNPKAGAVYTSLMDTANWYLPFNWKEEE